MKKQIFILVFALCAISFSNTYGQMTPRPFTCLQGDALHPIAGNPYSYSVSVPLPPGDKIYRWMVTQDQTFITNKVLVATPEVVGASAFLASLNSGTYNTATTKKLGSAASDAISFTWKSFTYDDQNPVFVIVNVVNADGTCSPNNMKVYRIEPINAFTLDIANIDQAGTTLAYDADNTECISEIVASQYNVTSGNVDYDFGADTIYYEVTAANWTTSWNLSVRLTGVNAEETVSVKWATDLAFGSPQTMLNTILAPTIYTSATNVVPTYAANTANGTVGSAGESIFIRVILDHSVGTLNYEGLTNETIVLAIDGKTQLAAAVADRLGDVHYANGQLSAGPPIVCKTPVADGYTYDIATQIIAPRPAINTPAAMPAPGFLLVNP